MQEKWHSSMYFGDNFGEPMSEGKPEVKFTAMLHSQRSTVMQRGRYHQCNRGG